MNKPKIFVIMPFDEIFFEVYEMIKNRFQDKYEFNNAAGEDNQQNILADIVQPIYAANIVLADLTGLNPNVMYELGVAHSLGKKTIIITQDDLAQLPFDLKSYRTKDYTTHFKKFNDLLEYLDKNFQGAIDNTVLFSNPVKDFLGIEHTSPALIATEMGTEKETMSLNEGGILDFITNIEEDAQKMLENLQQMAVDIQQLNTGVNQCSSEIRRIGQNEGQGNAAFLRKQSQKIANLMEKFSKELKSHNSTNETLWSQIEKNSLGLVTSNCFIISQNKEPIVNYLNCLKKLKEAVNSSKNGIFSIQEANAKNMGISRSLNQAVKSMNEDLDSYLTIMDQISAGIDRIIATSKFTIDDNCHEE